jgi:hypothetical protein
MTVEVEDRVDQGIRPAESRLPGQVPRALLVACSLVVLAAVVMIFVGAWKMGVTVDEPYHVQRFRHFLESGWYIVDFQDDNGRPGVGVTDQYVYGPATTVLLHILCRLVGVEGAGEVSITAHAYAVRHVGVGLLGVLGLFSVAATARLILRRWSWGLVAAAVLASTPMWTGHSMFNMKDIPVGTGYSLFTLALVIMAREERGSGIARRMLGSVTLAFGLYLAVGTRPGMWSGALASTTAFLVFTALRPPGAGDDPRFLRRHGWRYAELLAGIGAAAVALVALYPKVFGHPLTTALKSAHSSTNFLEKHTSWAYVPGNVMVEVPLVTVGLILVGVVVGLRAVFRTRLRPDFTATAFTLVAVQLFTLPAVAMVQGAALTSGLRQLLFAAPSAAVFAALGLSRWIDRAQASGGRRGRGIIAALGCVAVVIPTLEQATLFPYNYGYHNVLTELYGGPAYGPDYYRSSVRELAPQIPTTGRITCSPQGRHDGTVLRMAHLDGAIDCATGEASPLSQYADLRAGNQPPLKRTEFWAVVSTGVPENCHGFGQVTRGDGWRRLVMSTVARCELPFPIFPKTALTFKAELDNLEYFDRGWFFPDALGAHGMGGQSTMSFGVAPDFRGHRLRFEVDTAAPATTPVMVDGRPVAVSQGADGVLLIDIPAAASQATADDPMTVAFGSDGSPQIRITSMRLERADVP